MIKSSRIRFYPSSFASDTFSWNHLRGKLVELIGGLPLCTQSIVPSEAAQETENHFRVSCYWEASQTTVDYVPMTSLPAVFCSSIISLKSDKFHSHVFSITGGKKNPPKNHKCAGMKRKLFFPPIS